MNYVLTPVSYEELSTARTLVSRTTPLPPAMSVSPPTIVMGSIQKGKSHKWILYIPLFLAVMLLSGGSVYGYSFMNKPVIPVACVESVYVLQAGQSATCNDPRSYIDIVKNDHDVVSMCKCNK